MVVDEEAHRRPADDVLVARELADGVLGEERGQAGRIGVAGELARRVVPGLRAPAVLEGALLALAGPRVGLDLALHGVRETFVQPHRRVIAEVLVGGEEGVRQVVREVGEQPAVLAQVGVVRRHGDDQLVRGARVPAHRALDPHAVVLAGQALVRAAALVEIDLELLLLAEVAPVAHEGAGAARLGEVGVGDAEQPLEAGVEVLEAQADPVQAQPWVELGDALGQVGEGGAQPLEVGLDALGVLGAEAAGAEVADDAEVRRLEEQPLALLVGGAEGGAVGAEQRHRAVADDAKGGGLALLAPGARVLAGAGGGGGGEQQQAEGAGHRAEDAVHAAGQDTRRPARLRSAAAAGARPGRSAARGGERRPAPPPRSRWCARPTRRGRR